jgi:hypothetical protein
MINRIPTIGNVLRDSIDGTRSPQHQQQQRRPAHPHSQCTYTCSGSGTVSAPAVDDTKNRVKINHLVSN